MTHGTPTITLSDDERLALERLIANRNSPAKVVRRAQIILATARGLGTGAISKETGKDKTTIWRCQTRYAEEGIDGLTRDKTRPPGMPPLPDEIKAKVLSKTATETLRSSLGYKTESEH